MCFSSLKQQTHATLVTAAGAELGKGSAGCMAAQGPGLSIYYEDNSVLREANPEMLCPQADTPQPRLDDSYSYVHTLH